MSEAEALAVLDDVTHGRRTATPLRGVRTEGRYRGRFMPFCEVVPYEVGDGWQVGVFFDCADWDYVEWVRRGDDLLSTAGGGEVAEYSPDAEDEWARWHCLMHGRTQR